MKLPHFSIATKLYAIFALLATVTVALAAVAVVNARQHAALTDEFECAFAGALNVERVKALIYAIVMESRGIYLSPDVAAAKAYGAGLLKANDRIGDVVTEWQRAVRPDDAAQFEAFSDRIKQYQEFAPRAGAARHGGSARPRRANGAIATPTAVCARRSARTSSRSPSSIRSVRSAIYADDRQGHRHDRLAAEPHRGRGGAAGRRSA